MPLIDGLPYGAQCVYFEDPNEVLHCHVTGTCAAAFSVHVSAVFSVCAQGGVGEDPFALGFRKGGGHGTVDWLWRRTLTGRNSEVLAPMFFLHTTRCLRSFELVGSSRWEDFAFYALLLST